MKDKDKEIITLKDEERIKELISSSLSLFSENHEIIESNLASYEEKSILLGELLDKPKNYNLGKRMGDLKASFGWKGNSYSKRLLKVLKEIRRENTDSKDILDTFLKKLIEEIVSNLQLSEYTIICPVIMNFKDGVPSQLLKIKNERDLQLVTFKTYFEDYGTIISDYKKNFHQEEEIKLIQECDNNHYCFIGKIVVKM